MKDDETILGAVLKRILTVLVNVFGEDIDDLTFDEFDSFMLNDAPFTLYAFYVILNREERRSLFDMLGGTYEKHNSN